MRRIRKRLNFFGYESLVVWYNPNKRLFYWKKYRLSRPHEVGYINSYGHKACAVIDFSDLFEYEQVGFFKYHKKRFKKSLIDFLNRKL